MRCERMRFGMAKRLIEPARDKLRTGGAPHAMLRLNCRRMLRPLLKIARRVSERDNRVCAALLHLRPPLKIACCLYLVFVLLLASKSPLLAFAAPSQEKAAVKLSWAERRGVARYRLQLARDARFRDIIFDRVVSGTEHVIADLEPGDYYWRVAPAEYETGRFSTPTRIKIGDRPVPLLLAPHHSGWRTLTGWIAAPKFVRAGDSTLVVGTNQKGVTYALDARTGTARWVVRLDFDGSAADAWTLPIRATDGPPLIVAWNRALLLLDAMTGREKWRASLSARIVAVAVANDNASSVLVATAGPAMLASFDVATGRARWRAALRAEPRALWCDGASAVVVLDDGSAEHWTDQGQRKRALALQATTAPALVETRDGRYFLVGTVRGLAAVSLDLARVFWEVPLSAAPRGEIAVGGAIGTEESKAALIDRENRVVLFDLVARRVEWRRGGASDAHAPLFADVDGDGEADVIAAAGPAFAAAWRRRDGALLWQAEESATLAEIVRTPAERSLALVEGGDGVRYVVASDDVGLRAAALPPQPR